MASRNLPLLHKYVFHRDDDLQLKMSKLQYRLCVQEVSSVILGKQPGELDFSDIEPSIEPDYSMATTVEAHPPPRMEDFPSPTDEGLSSPESEDYPHKPQGQDYLYNDSGIMLDESSLNNTTQGDSGAPNGHLDNLSDTSSTSDPDYHISRHIDESHYHDDVRCGNNTHDYDPSHNDSAVHMNGDVCGLDDHDIVEDHDVVEETIEATAMDKTQTQIPFDKLPPADDSYVHPVMTSQPSPEPPQITIDTVSNDTDTDISNIDTQEVSNVHEDPDDDLEEIAEDMIESSLITRDTRLPDLDDVEKVDFVSGVTCEDVETALQILKTRYRLSCSTLKKCIITSPETRNKRYSLPVFSYDRSRWNLQDMIRAPNEEMPWWSETREPEPVVKPKDEMGAITDNINQKQDEIAALLQKVLDDERKKKDRLEPNAPAAVAEEPITQAEEPALEVMPEGDKETPGESGDAEPKKKKGNVFQRMMRALRKRLSRNRGRA